MFSVPLFSVLLLIHHHLLPHQDSNHPKVDRSALLHMSRCSLLPAFFVLVSALCFIPSGVVLYSVLILTIFPNLLLSYPSTVAAEQKACHLARQEATQHPQDIITIIQDNTTQR